VSGCAELQRRWVEPLESDAEGESDYQAAVLASIRLREMDVVRGLPEARAFDESVRDLVGIRSGFAVP